MGRLQVDKLYGQIAGELSAMLTLRAIAGNGIYQYIEGTFFS